MVRFGEFAFESASGRLWRGDAEIRLTPKAAAVLDALIRHAGAPVTRERLFELVWPDVVVTDDALGSCIQELRRSLGDDARSPLYIETRHRRGYRFVPEVRDAGPAPSSAPDGAPASTRAESLVVTEAIARRLDRAGLDARVIGSPLQYLDNHAASDTLVMLLNAAWLDGSDLEPHLRALPWRCFAPTLLGFEPEATRRFALSLHDHLVLLGELLRSMVERARPRRVVLAGFSASADLVLRLAGDAIEGVPRVDAVLALGPNQGLATCFGSRPFARLDGSSPDGLLQALRSIGDAATSVEDWSLVHGYMGRILARFGADVRPIRTLAQGLVQPFERDDTAEFARLYRAAAARVRRVRCVFEDSDVCNALLRAALLEHMERGVLGPQHRDGALRIEPTRSHFELVQPARVESHLADLLRELAASDP